MQNQYDDDVYNHSLLELMKKMRDRILPALLECTVKGTSSEDEVWASHFHFQTAFMYRRNDNYLHLLTASQLMTMSCGLFTHKEQFYAHDPMWSCSSKSLFSNCKV